MSFYFHRTPLFGESLRCFTLIWKYLEKNFFITRYLSRYNSTRTFFFFLTRQVVAAFFFCAFWKTFHRWAFRKYFFYIITHPDVVNVGRNQRNEILLARLEAACWPVMRRDVRIFEMNTYSKTVEYTSTFTSAVRRFEISMLNVSWYLCTRIRIVLRKFSCITWKQFANRTKTT